jgi:hypothetical protein
MAERFLAAFQPFLGPLHGVSLRTPAIPAGVIPEM